MAWLLPLLEGPRPFVRPELLDARSLMGGGLVLGFISGLTYALLAVGIVLVYKTNRFLNLAHAQFGALSALLLSKFVLDDGWSWWVAFPVVIAIGAAVGMLVERLIIRRLVTQQRSPSTMLLVSVGVSELLLALNYVPAVQPNVTRLQFKGYPLPFHSSFSVAGIVLGGQHILILILVPLLVIALTLFLWRSVWGKAIRACATNPDSARLCGIPLRRVNLTAWALAGGLSAITAVLQAPSQGTYNAAGFGPDLLLRALGAAALGGFTSIPMALAGGLLIGEAEQVSLALSNSTGPSELVVFVLVALIVIVRARAIGGQRSGELTASEEIRPATVPESVRNRFVVRRQGVLLGVLSLFVAVVFPVLPYFNSLSSRFDLTVIVIMAIASVGLTMLVGWSGQVSLGHFALLGLGAYLCAKLGAHSFSLPLILVIAAAAGAVLMTLIGLPAVRSGGLAVAVTTLGLAVVAPTWLFNQSWLGAPGNAAVIVDDVGLSPFGILHSRLGLYYVAVALLVISVVATRSLRRSLPGQLMVASRDNPRAVSSFGVAPASVRLSALAVSGAIVAAAGALWGLAWQSMSVDLVPAQLSLVLLAPAVIGGLGSVPGSVAGALAIYFPAFFISPHLSSIFGSFGQQIGFQLVLGGIGLVVIPLIRPGGLASIGQSWWEGFLGSVARDVEGRDAPDIMRSRVPAPREPVRAASTPAVDPAAPDGAVPLRITGLSTRIGGRAILHDVDLEIGPGEIVGLIGPNGAGKTTLMNVVSGHLPATGGTVSLFGQPVTSLAPDKRSRLGLGRNFQEARLFPGLQVWEALRVALARRQGSGLLSAAVSAPWTRMTERRARAQAEEIIESLGLQTWTETLTGELSTGTRRVCELATQLAAAPRMLLLDEPTAGLAQREAEAFGPLLKQVRESLQCSVLVIEHDMPLLMSLCDRVYAVAGGQVIASGTPDEVRANELVVATYLGTSDVAIERSGPIVPPRTKSRPRATTAAR
ncbi:MAG TPA: branched-chain amino acid ABC transporter permease/ATP-binding protein [Mycobacteriales bacterium]|nr:branched-chain amino acid ABC transporter permease/ATP-binding protein [Mycobacteriales bacterium]